MGLQRLLKKRVVWQLGRFEREIGVRCVLSDHEPGVSGSQVDGLSADQHHCVEERRKSVGRIQQRRPGTYIERGSGAPSMFILSHPLQYGFAL